MKVCKLHTLESKESNSVTGKAEPQNGQDGSFQVQLHTERSLELDGAYKGTRVLVTTQVTLAELWEFESLVNFKDTALWFFNKAFISWNLKTKEGEPMPTVGQRPDPKTGKMEQVILCSEHMEYPHLNAIIMGWYNMCTKAPPPLSTTSSAGKLSEVESVLTGSV